jgi:chromosome segregation ATPase
MSETVRISCVAENCGTFPMDKALKQKLQRSGETFCCPEGHAQHFTESKEQQLRERITGLESELEQTKRRLQSREETLDEIWDDYQEQKDCRKFAESRLLDYAKGIVEVADETYRWSCECDSRGQKAFTDLDACQSAFQEHRRRYCPIDEQISDSVEVEQ